MMKRFLINVSTYWCGTDDIYRAEAESESDLEEVAAQLAYDNYSSYGLDKDVAEEEGYDPEEMTDKDWEIMWNHCDEAKYYDYTIEEFTGDDNEWNNYGNTIIKVKNEV